MVGVPGRSKGCKTCLRRRVKCDEAKPACERCTKAGFNCAGYERERIWRNTTVMPLPEPGFPEMSIMASTATRAAIMPFRLIESPSPPAELALVAFQDDMMFTLMFTNHVWRATGAVWLDHAARGKSGQLSLNSAMSLAQANFGRAHRLSEVEEQGISLYGQCLRTLAVELANKPNQCQDLLIPVLVLTMLASFLSDTQGAASHVKGLARLLYMCEPQQFQEQPLLNAYEASRSILLIGALISKQRLFLEEPKWLTTPWLKHPAQKSQQSRVLDMLMLVPGLLKDFEAFSACPEENLDMHISILQGAKSLLVFLFQWRWHWQDRAGHEVGRDVGFASPEIGSSGELTKLRFRHFVLATDIMLYNSTLMWLMALISKLDPRNAILHIQECGTVAASQDGRSTQDRNDFEPLHRPGAVINMRDAALEIGRVFEWSSRHHDRSKETNCLYLFPVGMALTVLRAETNAVAWIQGLLNRSLATASYATRDNQSGFGFYLADETSFTDPGMLKVKQQLFSEQDVENSSKLGGQTRGVSPPQAGSHAALGSWQTIGS